MGREFVACPPLVGSDLLLRCYALSTVINGLRPDSTNIIRIDRKSQLSFDRFQSEALFESDSLIPIRLRSSDPTSFPRSNILLSTQPGWFV